jgi:hypothetical protein
MIKLVNLLEDVSSKRERAPKDRLIYAYTFPKDKYAYIGLTWNEKERARRHLNPLGKKSTAVSRYIKATGEIPHKEIVSATKDNPSGFVSEEEAKRLECYFMDKYKAEGWKLLNLAPCGSIGGGYDEDRIINGIDLFLKNPSTDLEALKLIPGSEFTAKAIKFLGLGDQVFNKLEGIVKSNNLVSKNQLRKQGSERAEKLIYYWDTENPGDSWQKKLFPDTTSGREKPKEAISAFLAEPDNLDKDQLKLITKRTHTYLSPKEEKIYLKKLKAIIDKYNIKSPQELNTITGGTALTWGLSDHDKNSNEKWKGILFPGGYLGAKGFKRSKNLANESIDNREIIKQIVKSCCSR